MLYKVATVCCVLRSSTRCVPIVVVQSAIVCSNASFTDMVSGGMLAPYDLIDK